MKKLTISTIASTVLLLSAMVSPAQTLLTIENASFENPVLAPTVYQAGAVGWIVSPDNNWAGTQNILTMGYSSIPDGNNAAIIASTGVISQVLTSNLSVGSYVLSAYASQNPGFDVVHEFKLQLLVGETLLAETTGTVPIGSFSQFTVNYTATNSDPLLGQALQIRVIGNSNNVGDYNQTTVDAFSLSYTAVPEPTSVALVMMAAGVCVVVMVRKARKSAQA